MCRWIHLARSIVLSFSLLLSVSACHQAPRPVVLTVEPEVSPQPPRVGPATIVLKLKDGSGGPIAGARVELEANMSHPGMSPVVGVASEISPGSYRCPIAFSMAGDWIITTRITLTDGQKLEREFRISGVRPD